MTDETKTAGVPSLTERFKRNWLESRGEYIAVPPDADTAEIITDFLRDTGIRSVVLAGQPLTPLLGEKLAATVEILADFGVAGEITRDRAVELCAAAEAGILGVDALIAEPGLLAQASRHRGDRLTATLPPLQLVVAVDAPVFSSLDAFLKSVPSEITFCFVAGPSRTADIEKQLVLGAHGPSRVVVFGP